MDNERNNAIDLRLEIDLDDEESDIYSLESSSGSSNEDEQMSAGDLARKTEQAISYDTSLPALHSYLGNNLEELSGRTVLDDDTVQTFPILSLPGVVLVPGQTLPLQLYNPSTISMMIHIIEKDRTFGIINSRFSGRQFTTTMDTIGTTAEIRSYREEEGAYGSNVLRIKAEGRQRFEVLETRTQADGILLGRVRILPELYVGDPGEGSKLASLGKFAHPPPNLNLLKKPDDFKCTQLMHRSLHKYNRFDFANYTWFPEFIYKMYDPVLLMERIKSMLSKWHRSAAGATMPCNPKEFSYWIAANLPLDDSQRIQLLRIDEVTLRLREELKILHECTVLCCRDCLTTKAHQEDIFSMSLQGPQGTYVNSNGYVHEAITVSKATGLFCVGRPSTEQSWFPGYAWTIVECDHCHSHLGWKYTAVNKTLKPLKFWALCRSAINNRISTKDLPEPIDV